MSFRVILILAVLTSSPLPAQMETWLEQSFDAPGAGAPFGFVNSEIIDSTLELSPPGVPSYLAGMATFDQTPVLACHSAWIVDFDFFLAPGPDGLAIIMSDENLIPVQGATHSYARVFLDTYQNPWDPNDNHIELRWGESNDPVWNADTSTVPNGSPLFDMNNGVWHHATISYQSGELSVALGEGGGSPEVILASIEVPILDGAQWWLRFLDFNASSTRVDNVVVQVLPCGSFVRGDCDSQGSVDIADALYGLNALFIPGFEDPACFDACDVEDDGDFDASDMITLFFALFVPASPQPPLPFPGCGSDPTPDGLDCAGPTSCP